ncbi:hypothetical protein N8603_06100 [Verrucomicrobiales bacterium]|nr:hypothetical protein [Verrucomicrobiales bacterium]
MSHRENFLHDLKTERQDLTKPLPKILIIVPILFFISLIGAIFLNVLFFLKIKEAEALSSDWQQRAESEVFQKKQTGMTIDLIKKEEQKGQEIHKWVEGAMQMQPLALSVSRSMGPKSSIEELSLYKDKNNPNQILIQLSFINGGQKQLDDTLSAINTVGYRAYSANQSSEQGGKVNYKATLILQNNESINKELTTNYE